MLKKFIRAMSPKVENIVHAKDLTRDCLEAIDLRYNAKSLKPDRGTSSGFKWLDISTRGMQDGELIIVAGRPSMGKSAFVSSIAQYLSISENMPILYFSLEMTKEVLIERFLCSNAQVDLHKIRTGFLTGEERSRLSVAAGRLSEAPIYIDDSLGLCVDELCIKASRFKKQKSVRLIIIDRLQLLYSSVTSECGKDKMVKMCQALKRLAEYLKIPILLTSQLSKDADLRDDHRPHLCDLMDSGLIERYADMVLLLFREEYYNPTDANQGLAEIVVAKNRKGGAGTVPFEFLGEFLKFQDISEEREKIFFSEKEI